SFAVVILPGPGTLAVSAPGDGYMPAAVTPTEVKAFFKDNVERATDHTLEILYGVGQHSSLRQQDSHALVLLNPGPKSDSLTRDVALQPGKTVSGTVTDPDGKPVMGVTVYGLGRYSEFAQPLDKAAFTVRELNPRRSRTLILLHREKQLGAL